MAGSEVIAWLQEYYFDFIHWQESDIFWLLARTAILFVIVTILWNMIVRSVFKRLSRLWHDYFQSLFYRINPLRIPRAIIRRRQQKKQEEEALRFQQERQIREAEEQRRRQEEEERAYALIRDTLSIQESSKKDTS